MYMWRYVCTVCTCMYCTCMYMYWYLRYVPPADEDNSSFNNPWDHHYHHIFESGTNVLYFGKHLTETSYWISLIFNIWVPLNWFKLLKIRFYKPSKSSSSFHRKNFIQYPPNTPTINDEKSPTCAFTGFRNMLFYISLYWSRTRLFLVGNYIAYIGSSLSRFYLLPLHKLYLAENHRIHSVYNH